MALTEKEYAAEKERNDGLKKKIAELEGQLKQSDETPVGNRTTEFNAARGRASQMLDQAKRELDASNGRLVVPSNAETPIGVVSAVGDQAPQLVPDENNEGQFRQETPEEVQKRLAPSQSVSAEGEPQGSNTPPLTGPPRGLAPETLPPPAEQSVLDLNIDEETRRAAESASGTAARTNAPPRETVRP